MLPGYPTAAAVILRGEDFPHPIIPVGAPTPQSKATAFSKALGLSQPGDLILAGLGDFDWGNAPTVVIPPGVKVEGKQTRFLNSKRFDPDPAIGSDFGPAFALSDKSEVAGISFVAKTVNPPNSGFPLALKDNAAVGFLSTTAGASARIRYCSIWASDWALYGWSPGNYLLVEDTDLIFGRIGVGAEDSGDGCNFGVYRTRFFGDASLSGSQGAVSSANGVLAAAVCRGGFTRLIDCESALKGNPNPGQGSLCPRVCTITDMGGGNSQPAGNTRVQVYNFRSSISPNGCDPSACWDIDIQTDYVRPNIRIGANCWGSAPDGSLSKSY